MSTTSIIIRNANPTDDAAIAELLAVSYQETPKTLEDEMAMIRERFNSFGDLTPGILQWVAELDCESGDNNTIIGVLEATIRLFANGCETVHILFVEGVAVAANNQQDGVSMALLEAATQWAKKAGIREIASDCEIDNKVGQQWHQSAGFVPTETVITYVKKID